MALVFGVHPVSEVLRRRGGEVQVVITSRRGRIGDLVRQAADLKVPVINKSSGELDALCESTSHQGVAAVVGTHPYLDLHQLLELGAPPMIVVADSLTDPQNLGSIIRSAAVLGATGLVVPKKRSAQITPTVIKVSAGASESLPCARVTNIARSLEEMKEAGLWIAGAVEGGGMHPADADLTGPVALVLGNEHKGLRPLVLKACDLRLTIPSMGAIASLNVGAAAAALLYEVARQRRGQGG